MSERRMRNQPGVQDLERWRGDNNQPPPPPQQQQQQQQRRRRKHLHLNHNLDHPPSIITSAIPPGEG